MPAGLAPPLRYWKIEKAKKENTVKTRENIYLAINRPMVSDAKAARQVLDRYASDLWLEVVAEGKGGEGMLTLDNSDVEPNEWPLALRVEELPSEDDFPDNRQLHKVVTGLYERRGDDGFVEMLRELGPVLRSPLVVQAASCDSDRGFIRAKEWTVQPGACEVGIKEISPLEVE
jgi:hypothetical protein